MALNYERIGWENAPSTNTPIDAGSLNHMDNGILAVSNQYDVDVPYLQQQVAGIPAMLDSYLAEEIGTDVTAWLNAHVTPGGSTIVVDDTLSISGAAADAAKCGELKNALDAMTSIEFTETAGYYNANGTISGASSNAQEKYTNKIPVKTNDVMDFSIKFPSSVGIWVSYCLFNENGNFLSRTIISDKNGYSEEKTVTIPSGAYYIAFSYRTWGTAERAIKRTTKVPEITKEINDVNAELTNLDNRIDILEYVNFGNAEFPTPLSEWIRYSDGEIFSSSATRLYLFTGKLPKYIEAFLTSDSDVLCAIAFFNSETIGSESYMKSSSVQFASGTHDDGLWYKAPVPDNCLAVAITTKVPSASVVDPIIKFDAITSVAIEIANENEYFDYPIGVGYISGWVRHGTGELVNSQATECYTFENNGISKMRVFTKSDTTVIDVAAFYSGKSISTDTYLQSSIPWAGVYSSGKWYDIDVPSGAKLIAISVVKAADSYSPVIQFKMNDILLIMNSRYVNKNESNDIVLSGGWKYIYHYGMNGVAYRDVEVTIPSQSVFDIRNAHNLGYQCIEANVHRTSDGKYVVTHGLDGGLGHDFNTLNGEDAYGVKIYNTTYANLRENYRYRSTVAEYRTPITSLEEFCHVAKKYNMIVMFMYVDAPEIDIIKGIMGTRFFMYNAPRNVYNGPILGYYSYTTKAEILSKCESVGKPYIYSMGNTGYFSDADLQDIIDTLHQNGYYIATAYVDGANLLKLSAMGFDFFAVGENYVANEIILDGKKLIFNLDGSVTWTEASLS